MGELLTVAEFAEQAGISKQAVYKQLKKKLKQYLVVKDRQKFIKSEGLRELQPVEQPIQPVETAETATESAEVEQPFQPFQSEVEQPFQSEVETLREQIRIKDEQIADLMRLLDQQQKITMTYRVEQIEKKSFLQRLKDLFRT